MVSLKEYKELLKKDNMIFSGGNERRKRTLEVLEMFETGKYTTKEISEKVKLTQRHIQTIISYVDEFNKYGRTRDVPIFTVLDLIYASKNPEKINEIIERKYMQFHKTTTEKNLKRNKDTSSHIVKRAILRAEVLYRDNYTCQNCGTHIALEVHHIKEVRNHEHLEFKLDNCITLCHTCHDRKG